MTFDAVAAFAKNHWGLTFYRCDPKNRGRWNGCWKSGFGLCGNFPGDKHSHRRFRSIKQAAEFLGFRPEKMR